MSAQPNRIPPQVAALDKLLCDATKSWEQHEKFREMRKLAIKLETEVAKLQQWKNCALQTLKREEETE